MGTQSSKQFRLLGESQSLEIAAGDDPREQVVEWMQRPDNPFFAKASVNRVWAHYFGRGIVDPPDDLSPLNPATHPKLLDELCRRFISGGYDLKWLHRTILTSRTYQQSSTASRDNEFDRTNYAYFYFRRLGAEVLLDSTIVLALGEMGRKPKCGTKKEAGRDHWDYAQFVLAAGGGFKRGAVVGATDKLGEQVTDNFYKIESFGRTLYHQLGIDADTIVRTLGNRPVKLIAEEAPLVKEALA